MNLVLFDIDGTILATSGAGRRAMEASLITHFGTPGPTGYRYDGKTDIQIVRESMRNAGHDDATINARIPSVLELYLRHLDEELTRAPEATQVYAGVVALLDALDQREDCIVGLLTGNLVGGARRKLTAASLAFERFRVGAFGSDHEHRHELPAIAVARAREELGVGVTGERVVIIGDTPADVLCGRGIGARAIAVATGHYSVEQLNEHAPHLAVPDLSDTAHLVQVIVNA